MPTKSQHLPRRVTPLDKQVGNRMRIARLAAQISQEKLAAACGVSFQQIQKYEKGLNRIGAGRLPVIANALGVGVLYFFDDAPTPTTAKSRATSSSQVIISGVLSNPLGMRLNKAFAQLGDRKAQYRIVELVEKMVARSVRS